MSSPPSCRFCRSPLTQRFIDLGMSPLCESLVSASQLDDMEPFYPLQAFVCGSCFLVQLREYVPPVEIFSEYAYFSSYSDSWLRHASRYVDMAIARFGLGRTSRVVELASNDGYLLQFLVARGVPVLGVEPAANVAQAAIDKGIPTRVDFFGEAIAGDILAGGAADLIVGNNVLAQVPDLNDFVRGMKVLLKPGGVITLEFPHLERLIEGNQFDTIYHEHYSYFSFMTVRQILRAHGLAVFDVEELPSHGGSLRVFARHEDGPQAVSDRVPELDARERAAGVTGEAYYARFAEKVQATKRALLEVLIRAKGEGLSIAGYGAPGKGNILLNYCGIRTDFLDYTVDRNPYKQGRYLPGTHVPIRHPDHIRETRPDLVLILPWNLEAEIVQQLAYIREWGGRFLIPIPEARIIP